MTAACSATALRLVLLAALAVAMVRGTPFVVDSSRSFAADASNGAGDHGASVAVAGDGSVAAVGVPAFNGNVGRVEVYRIIPAVGAWGLDQIIENSGGSAGDNFGRSVSVNGDGSLIAIGSVSAAAVFAYDTDGSSWLSGSAVGPRDGSNTDAFGSAVALSPDGTWLVVGDPTCSGPSPVGDGPIVAYGCLETFSGSGDGTFSPAERLYHAGAEIDANDGFGTSVAVSNDRLVAGRPSNAVGVGGVTIFALAGGSWSVVDHANAPSAGWMLGSSVAIGGDYVVAGAPTGSDSGEGAAVLIDHASDANTILDTYVCPGTACRFGTAVAIDTSGDLVVVSAPDAAFGGRPSAGVIYVLDNQGGSLSLAAELGFATAATGEDAGLALGLASDTGSTLAVTHALDAKVEFWSTCGGSDSWADAGTPPPASPCDSTTDTDLCPDDGLVNGCISGIPVCDTPSGDNDLDLCDGEDNDCNAETMDGADEATWGLPCDGPDSDLCLEGIFSSCDGVSMVCDDATDDNVEICDGLNNDCRADTPDGFAEFGLPCDGEDSDLCEEGTYTDCQAATLICSDDTSDTLDVCNGIDDDCNEATLDGYDSLGTPCDGDGDTDLCAEGTVTSCVGGEAICDDSTGDNLDLCNGDTFDDCNPETPDGSGETWFEQACDGPDSDFCTEGVYSCVAGSQECSDTSDDTLDVCNGVNDDCDGTSQDGSEDPLIGTPCDGDDTDFCAEGVYSVCFGGELICNDETTDDVDICNGEDDDCDASTGDGSAHANFGEPCDGSDVDMCMGGNWICDPDSGVTGSLVCSDSSAALNLDLCNGNTLDDCNNNTADGAQDPRLGLACDGPDDDRCDEGVFAVCTDGVLVCNDNTDSRIEMCDGIDNDCRSNTPDGYGDPEVGVACDGSDTDVCKGGVVECIDGEYVCSDDDAVDICPDGCDPEACGGYVCAIDYTCRLSCEFNRHCREGFRCDFESATCIAAVAALGACTETAECADTANATYVCRSSACQLLDVEGGCPQIDKEPSEGLDAEHIVLLVVVGAPCLLGIVIVLLSCAYARMTTEHSVHYWTVASIIVSVIDLVTDLFFALSLSSTYLTVGVLFVVLPLVVNTVFAVWFLLTQGRTAIADAKQKGLDAGTGVKSEIFVVVIVSVFNLEWLALLESHLFGLPAFDVHKSRLGELLIRYGRVTNIVFEDIPQIILVIIVSSSCSGFTPLGLVSILASLASILLLLASSWWKIMHKNPTVGAPWLMGVDEQGRPMYVRAIRAPDSAWVLPLSSRGASQYLSGAASREGTAGDFRRKTFEHEAEGGAAAAQQAGGGSSSSSSSSYSASVRDRTSLGDTTSIGETTASSVGETTASSIAESTATTFSTDFTSFSTTAEASSSIALASSSADTTTSAASSSDSSSSTTSSS